MKRYAAIVAVCLLFLTAAGCGKIEESSRYLPAMDTIMEFTVYGSNGQEGLTRCTEIVRELEQLLSVTDSESAVYALNETGTLEQPDGHITHLLAVTNELAARTDGALDVTVYPVVRAWGFTGEEYRIPGEGELTNLLTRVDWSAVSCGESSITLPEGAMLDFGSVAKGYAGSLAADALRDLGVTSALLNLGGNVQTVGGKPDGSDWRIAVKDPFEPESGTPLGVLSLNDEAAVTSGGYERYFEEDGVRYWHIIDPDTGYPADSGLVSVTVVGKDGAICDGLSTALFILGKEKALEYWRTWGGFEAILVEEDGNVTVTAGLKERFELTRENAALTIAGEI